MTIVKMCLKTILVEEILTIEINLGGKKGMKVTFPKDYSQIRLKVAYTFIFFYLCLMLVATVSSIIYFSFLFSV